MTNYVRGVKWVESGLNYKDYIVSVGWRERADHIKEWKNYTCEICKKRFDKNNQKGLVVHHKTYERLGNEKSEDLMVLCTKCHKEEHERLIKLNKRTIN